MGLFIDAERAERMAKKANARRAAKAPLFAYAGLLEGVSPQQIQTSYQNWFEKLRQAKFAMEEKGLQYKQLVQQNVTPEAFTALCEWAAYLERLDSCYRADYWHRQLKEVNLRLYQDLCDYCHDPANEVALSRRKATCLCCGRVAG